AFRVSDDYALPGAADKTERDWQGPRVDQLKPAPDTVLVLFYSDVFGSGQDEFEILRAHLLERQGRRLRYPLRPFVFWATSVESGSGIGLRELGVIAFAKDCWPVVYMEMDGWVSQRGGFVHKPGGFIDKADSTPGLMCPRGCVALAHVVLVPRHRPFAPIAICTAGHAFARPDTWGVSRLLAHAGRRMIKTVGRSRELTDEHRLMVFTQMKDLAERLARPPNNCTPLLNDLRDRLAHTVSALRQKKGAGEGSSGGS
ncbi:MAG: hypothetical protein ACYS5V_13705, partial [Planctomycetota bacterium]